MLEKSGSMSNPHDYRELMCAVYGFSTKTVDEVLAEQKARHKRQMDDAKAEAKVGGVKSSTVQRAPRPVPAAAIPKKSLDGLAAILERSKQVRAKREG